MNKDCKDCKNCCSLHGFMCNCRYSYNDERGHHQVGQFVRRQSADKCKHYTTKEYNRDKLFVL